MSSNNLLTKLGLSSLRHHLVCHHQALLVATIRKTSRQPAKAGVTYGSRGLSRASGSLQHAGTCSSANLVKSLVMIRTDFMHCCSNSGDKKASVAWEMVDVIPIMEQYLEFDSSDEGGERSLQSLTCRINNELGLPTVKG